MFKFDDKTKENLAALAAKVGENLKLTSKSKQNLAATAIGGAIALAVAAPIMMSIKPKVADPELGAMAEITFPDLADAIANAGRQIINYDPADRLSEIHDLMLDGEAEEAQYRRMITEGGAAAVFDEVAQDGIYLKSYSCSARDDGSYKCDLDIVELGGVVEEGAGTETGLGACEIVNYDITVTPADEGYTITAFEGDRWSREHRISDKYALAVRVDLAGFTEEAPHQGPLNLSEITTANHVRFHPNAFRTGGGFLTRSLGEEQLAAERVFAALSNCMEVPEAN